MKIIYPLFSFILLFVFTSGCKPQKSNLPHKIPENFAITYSENGGMSPYSLSILISSDSCSYFETDINRKTTSRIFIVDSNQMNTLYEVLIANSIDRITNTKANQITYDAGSEGIWMRAGNISHQVSCGRNSPFKNIWHRRNYTNVKTCLFDIFSLSSVGYNKNSKTRDNLNTLILSKFFDTRCIKSSESKSNDINFFESLEKDLTEEDWLILSNHSNRVVIGYAYLALMRKGSKNALRILEKVYVDKYEVDILDGIKKLKKPFNHWIKEITKEQAGKNQSPDDILRYNYYLERIK